MKKQYMILLMCTLLFACSGKGGVVDKEDKKLSKEDYHEKIKENFYKYGKDLISYGEGFDIKFLNYNGNYEFNRIEIIKKVNKAENFRIETYNSPVFTPKNRMDASKEWSRYGWSFEEVMIGGIVTYDDYAFIPYLELFDVLRFSVVTPIPEKIYIRLLYDDDKEEVHVLENNQDLMIKTQKDIINSFGKDYYFDYDNPYRLYQMIVLDTYFANLLKYDFDRWCKEVSAFLDNFPSYKGNEFYADAGFGLSFLYGNPSNPMSNYSTEQLLGIKKVLTKAEKVGFLSREHRKGVITEQLAYDTCIKELEKRGIEVKDK